MKLPVFALSLLLASAVHADGIELLTPAAVESGTAEGGASENPVVLSADGRWIAFPSYARNLVPGQHEGPISSLDVFLHDRQTGTTVLVSHAFGSPTQAVTGLSFPMSISADGRWVGFLSRDNNLVPGQDPQTTHLQAFLYDRDTGTNTLVSHAAAGPLVESLGSAQEVRVSADGSWVAFSSDAADLVAGLAGPASVANVFLYERATGDVRLVSRAAGTTLVRGNRTSFDVSMTPDGRYLAFESQATDLVAGYTGSLDWKVYLFDRVTGTMALVSRSAASATEGVPGRDAAISADGSTVAFLSTGDNLVAGQVDENAGYDAFLYDRATGTNILASRSTASPVTAGNRPVTEVFRPRISDTGGYVAFVGEASDAVAGQVDGSGTDDLFLFERATSSLTLVSHASGAAATAANQLTSYFTLSADGRFVAYQSRATDLVSGQIDAGQDEDVFLFDRTTATSMLASGAGGSPQNAGRPESFFPTISADGTVVAFTSWASDLAAGTADLNTDRDTMLFDRVAGTTSVASLAAPGMASGTAGAASVLRSASAGARYAVIQSAAENLVAGQVDANHGSDLFLVNRVAGTTTLVSRSTASATTAGNGESTSAAISADGSWIVFASSASDLVPGQVDTPGTSDIFLYERATGTITLLSHAAGSPLTVGDAPCGGWDGFGTFVPAEVAISEDGRWIAFECEAGNLVAGQTESWLESIDVFLHDRVTGQTTLVSRGHASADTAGNNSSGRPRLSADGRWIAFLSRATNLVAGATDNNGVDDLFLHDRDTGQTFLASRAAGTAATAADNRSQSPALSADGKFVAFTSTATNLVPGQVDPPRSGSNQDVFLFDRVAGTVELISRASGSATATPNGLSTYAAVDAAGRHVAFYSEATNLVPGQTGPKGGVFLHDRVTRATELLSHTGASRTETQGILALPVLSPDGRFVAFVGYPPLYLADRRLGTLERIAEAYAFFTSGTDPVPTSVAALSPDGSAVLFTSYDRSLSVDDFNNTADVYAYTRMAPAASDFYTIEPCRLVSTPQTGPAPVSGQTALLDVHGACGVPATATAVALNVTVLQSTGAGRLSVYPGNILAPGTSTINFKANQTLANNAVLPLATNGDGTLGLTPFVTGGGTVHVIVDLSGYFE